MQRIDPAALHFSIANPAQSKDHLGYGRRWGRVLLRLSWPRTLSYAHRCANLKYTKEEKPNIQMSALSPGS